MKNRDATAELLTRTQLRRGCVNRPLQLGWSVKDVPLKRTRRLCFMHGQRPRLGAKGTAGRWRGASPTKWPHLAQWS